MIHGFLAHPGENMPDASGRLLPPPSQYKPTPANSLLLFLLPCRPFKHFVILLTRSCSFMLLRVNKQNVEGLFCATVAQHGTSGEVYLRPM